MIKARLALCSFVAVAFTLAAPVAAHAAPGDPGFLYKDTPTTQPPTTQPPTTQPPTTPTTQPPTTQPPTTPPQPVVPNVIQGDTGQQTGDVQAPAATTPTTINEVGGLTGARVVPAAAPLTATPAALPASPSTGSLPFTGGDVAGLAVLGLGLLAIGGVLVRRNRATHRAVDAG